MKVISFLSVKGGVAKSSSTIAVAGILSESKRVLLIDSDPQNAATSHFYSDDQIDDIRNRTIRQLLLGTTPITDCIFSLTENLFFIPSEIELTRIEKEMAGNTNQFFRLNQALKKVEDYFDYVIIDTGPNINLLSQQAVIASDIIVMPAQLEKWAIRVLPINFEQIIECEKSKSLIGKETERIFILPTWYEGNNRLKNQYLDLLRDQDAIRAILTGYFKPGTENYEICQTIIGRLFTTKTLIHKSAEVGKTYAENNSFLPAGSRSYHEYAALVKELFDSSLGVHPVDSIETTKFEEAVNG